MTWQLLMDKADQQRHIPYDPHMQGKMQRLDQCKKISSVYI